MRRAMIRIYLSMPINPRKTYHRTVLQHERFILHRDNRESNNGDRCGRWLFRGLVGVGLEVPQDKSDSPQ